MAKYIKAENKLNNNLGNILNFAPREKILFFLNKSIYSIIDT